MRRSLSLFIIIIMIFSLPVFASPARDWKADSICTRISSISTYVSSITYASGQFVQSTPKKIQTIGYSEDGFRNQDIRYDSNGKQKANFVYNYIDLPNKTVQLVDITEYNSLKKIVSIEKMDYSERSKGILKTTKVDAEGKLIYTTIYHENAKGLDVLSETFDANNILIYKVETVYNDNNDIILLKETDPVNNTVVTTTTVYDGPKVTFQSVDDGSKLIINKYYYDKDNNWEVKESYLSKNGKTGDTDIEIFEVTQRLLVAYG